ncbi:hypothetical protein Tco_0289868 [Tanacetum coccineum]
MEGYTVKQLKGFNFEVIKDMFDKAFKRVNTFFDYKTELMEKSSKKAEAEKESNEKVEAELDDDQEEAKIKEHMEIVIDEEEITIDVIPLATKPLIIVDYKIINDRKMGYFQIRRDGGSSKRHSAFIDMLRDFDREDLETLWKLVKAKHGSTRPKEDYERVPWGDQKTMF